MSATLYVLDSVKSRLLQHAGASDSTSAAGWLVGLPQEEGVLISSNLRSTANFDKTAELQADLEESSSLLPAGLGIVGAYVLLKDKMTIERQSVDLAICSFVALHTYQQLHIYGARPDLSADAKLNTSQGQALPKAIAKAVDVATEDLCCLSAVVVAGTSSTEPCLLNSTDKQIADNRCCGDLKGASREAVNLTVLHSGSVTAGPPCIHYQPVASGPCSYDRVTLNLSILCVAPNAMPLSDVRANLVQPAIKRQLGVLQQRMSKDGSLSPWTAFQVQPPGWPHPLTLMYSFAKTPAKTPSKGQAAAQQPSPEKEQELRSIRQALHQRLGLPSNRPLLRLNNAVDPRAPRGGPQALPGGPSARLQDVHVGMNPPQVPGGTVHMIEGSYDYHHYMQDKTDDAGWGCAYRSLQTIHSWFRHQHYTQAPVPALRDIQQTLVDIGDKAQAFVGSREWIGAIELGYVLDEQLGVAAKVITVSSGADMGSKAREIAQHFDTQGTPIMIGGGVLAYTLLGISYNEKTGECAFLILDPHYTGGEDLSKVQNGQWVAWKSPSGKAAAGGPLLVQGAFYNLLCPQRPDMI